LANPEPDAAAPPPVPGADPRDRRWIPSLAILLAAAAALRLLALADFRAGNLAFDVPRLDSRAFLAWAERISAGDVAGSGAFFLNPLYPYLIAPLVGGPLEDVVLRVRLLQALLGLGTVLCVALAARRILGDPRAALAAGAAAAAWPFLLHEELILLATTTIVFLNALALWFLARWHDRRSPLDALGAGLALGVGVLGRPNLLPFATLLPLWFAWRTAPGARGGALLRHGGALLLGLAIPLAPCLARNLAVLGEPVLTTTSMGPNLWITNNPMAWETGGMECAEFLHDPLEMEPTCTEVAEAAEGRPLAPTEVSRHWARRAVGAMAQEPGTAARFLLRKALYFLDGREIPSSYCFELAVSRTAVIRRIPLSFAVLAPLAILGALLLRGNPAAAPALAMAAISFAGLVAFIPLDHYRAPALPALFPLAAAAALRILDALRSRAGILPLAAGLAGAILLCQGARIAAACGIPSLGPYPVSPAIVGSMEVQAVVDEARRLLDAGRAAEAAPLSAAARVRVDELAASVPDADPARWIVETLRANVAEMHRDFDAEERHLEDVLRRKPGDGHALLFLARNRARRGRWDGAVEACEALLAGRPRDPRVFVVLAMIYRDAGRVDRARECARRAADGGHDLPADLRALLAPVR
jgi:4-amino-4-deoxy-L-arabinose transferase-like glycosyltransferase